MKEEKNFRRVSKSFSEESPIIEFSTLLIIGAVLLLFCIACAILFLPLEITVGLFISIFGLIVIFINPYFGLLIFVVALFTQPATFFVALQPFHLVRVLSFATLFGWVFNMMITRNFKIVKSPQNFFILGFGFLVLCSSFQNPDYSFVFFVEALKVFILVFLIVNLIKNRGLLFIFIWVMVGIGSILSMLAIYQYFHGIGIVYDDGMSRVTGTLDDPNDFALHLIIILPLMVYLFREYKTLLLKIILLISSCLLMLAVVFTYSRGGLLGLSIVLFLLFIQLLFQKQRIRWPYILIAIAVVLILIPFIPSKYWQRFMSGNIFQDAAVVGRLQAWRTGWEMMKDKPFIGTGLATFKYLYYPYAPLGLDSHRVIVAHNMFISIGAEIGFFGLAFFLSIIGYAFRALHQAQKNFKKRGNSSMSALSQSLGISLVGFCACSMFLSVEWLSALWILIALGTTLKNLSESGYGGKLI